MTTDAVTETSFTCSVAPMLSVRNGARAVEFYQSAYSPESLGGGTVRMILTVPEPDAMFARALAAGARAIFAVEEEHGWRLGRVLDPFGHHWEIGRPLSG